MPFELPARARAAAAVHVGLVERVATVYRILVSGGGTGLSAQDS